MIRSLYPEIADRVQAAIAREGRFMLPDIALVEHVIDLLDAEISTAVDALAEADLHPHVVSPQRFTGEAVADPANAALVVPGAHDSPQG